MAVEKKWKKSGKNPAIPVLQYKLDKLKGGREAAFSVWVVYHG